MHLLHNAGVEGLSNKPNALCTGSNSGYQAVGLAIAAGARQIILLGYDMRFIGGRSHWHGGHPVQQSEGTYTMTFAANFRKLRAPGVDILNATPGSALNAFPFVDLERVFP